MKRLSITFVLFLAIVMMYLPSMAQANKNAIYVDPQGRIRWQKDHSEVYLFGVNYTVPFAYGYRSYNIRLIPVV